MASKYEIDCLGYYFMDISKNEIPGINVRSPGTMLWYKKGPKNARDFEDITHRVQNVRKMGDYKEFFRNNIPEFLEKWPRYQTFEEKQMEKKKKAQEEKDKAKELADEALDYVEPVKAEDL